jgi:lysosomal alpha-mannosidase
LNDDSWGVDEALNETAFGIGLIARGRHYLMAGAINGESPNMAAQERELAIRKHLSPWLFFSPGGTSFEAWKANYKMEVRVQ